MEEKKKLIDRNIDYGTNFIGGNDKELPIDEEKFMARLEWARKIDAKIEKAKAKKLEKLAKEKAKQKNMKK